MDRALLALGASVVLAACGRNASGGGSETGEPLPICEADPQLGTAPSSIPSTVGWDASQTEDCRFATYYQGVGDVDGDGVLEVLALGVETDSCPRRLLPRQAR